MNKLCIMKINKNCVSCGECLICDLNAAKKCDNCGKCLNINDAEMRVVNIDEINEEQESFEDDETIFEDLSNVNDNKENKIESDENVEKWELIGDIDGLSEVLDDEKSFKNILKEEFPGLIVLNKHR